MGGVLLAGAADAADGRHALLEGGEAAIASAAGAAAAVDRAPRIILRLRRRTDRRDGNENSQRQKQDSHWSLPHVARVERSETRERSNVETLLPDFAEPVIGPATSGRTRWLNPGYI